MALNKYMHPRNIYRNPPEFTKLAELFEEFNNIVKKDVTGKIMIDFKDPHVLRTLTKCLLKSDFNLDIVIPEDRLVPTLPLRLNYILWIEDLLNSIQRHDNIHGLDIGTGACAIYPLLAAVKNGWHMLGTETDLQSFLKAQENVNKNNLQSLVKLEMNITETLLDCWCNGERDYIFDFSMCNPPFYSNEQELLESRSPARHPPKNGFTGSPQELITEGGELAFCRKMIEESKMYKNNVRIFTTMVGHKYNLKELAQDLKAECIKHTSTEFCQGRVTRWGLAWTYQDVEITLLVPARGTLRKKNIPIVYTLPELPGCAYNLENVNNKLLSILQDLKIDYKILNKRGSTLSYDIKASTNTWSNQRRKRRLLKQQELLASKKAKLDDANFNKDVDSSHKSTDPNEALKLNNTEINVIHEGLDTVDCSLNVEKVGNSTASNNNEAELNTFKTPLEKNYTTTSSKDDNITCNLETKSSEQSTQTKSSEQSTPVDIAVVVHAFVKILKKDKYFHLEIEFLDGSAGKEGLHQIVTYIKNNWK